MDNDFGQIHLIIIVIRYGSALLIQVACRLFESKPGLSHLFRQVDEVVEDLQEPPVPGRGAEEGEHRLDHLPLGLGGESRQQQQLCSLPGGQQRQGLQLGTRETGVQTRVGYTVYSPG